MKNNFKYTPLAIMIASALSLSGCGESNSGSVPDTASSGDIAASNVVEANAETARVKLAVKFPEADASAAWIGDSKSIEVSFFNTQTVGSIAEAEQEFTEQCGDDNDYGCYSDSEALHGQFATSIVMDTNAPSAYVDLLPGKYRIEAKFYNGNGKHQETSVSYVTLSKGEHSLKLRGLEATWTATEQLSLQLLNNDNDFDWDTKTEGLQTAAEIMGVTGAIVGLHLPSVLTYPDGYLYADKQYAGQGTNKNVLINAGVLNSEELDRESQATAFQPVLRIADANGGEFNLLPRFSAGSEELTDEQGEYIGESGSWNKTELTTLQQEYSSAGDKAYLDLGSYNIGSSVSDNSAATEIEHSAKLILGIASLNEDTEPKYSIVYKNEIEGVNAGEALTIARININDANDEANWQQLFVDLQATATQIVDGSTVTGSLIEVERHTTKSTLEYAGGGEYVTPVSFLEAALFDIAEKEGLVAQAAADSSCTTQAISGAQYSNDYRWDEAQQGWVAGTYNTFLSESGLLANIDDRIAEQTAQRDTAQSELDAGQEELAVYDNQIITLVEAQIATITSTIAEVDTVINDNSELIANYQNAKAEEASAYTAFQEKNAILQAAWEQVGRYDSGLLPDCDTACYELLLQAQDTARSEYNAAWDFYDAKSSSDFYTAYQFIEQDINGLIAPFNIYVSWDSSVIEVASSALQTRSAALQATLDQIENNQGITDYSYDSDNWELYNNRQNALGPVTNALENVASANDALTQLAQLKADALAAADLNGDGEATLFEEGVYLAGGWLGSEVQQGSWDENTGEYTDNDTIYFNDFEVKNTVKASTLSGEQTICVQPFTLKASPLSLQFDTAADVVIE